MLELWTEVVVTMLISVLGFVMALLGVVVIAYTIEYTDGILGVPLGTVFLIIGFIMMYPAVISRIWCQ
jgi:hypothetical protein